MPGFLGFYSTIRSSGLAAKLNVADLPFEARAYDREEIERVLLASPSGLALAKRFFPRSFAIWHNEHPQTADLLFREKPSLSCFYCKKSLLEPEPHGIVVVWSSRDKRGIRDHKRVEHLYWCCRGPVTERCNSATGKNASATDGKTSLI